MAGALLARATALLIAAATSVLADEPPNPVCRADIHRAGNFDLRQIGPLIAGTWAESAIGASVAIGAQKSTFEIIYDQNRNRLYLGADGIQTELVPVRGGNKPLRYDFVHGKAMDPQFHMMVPEPPEWALVHDCEIASAPQFEWQFGTGERRSDGIISFLSASEAMGTKRNSARGVREQLISR
ncbi:hypothetical protein [Pelagibacterium sediminicola]|uniref:hypothetical protein n=1 Tax=Pelagibacterium sediminicola TaxID=2248761 RepID=UPI000E30DA5E|nr:hypothetical protein [Pelagibacterium sediminicola]